ncbi:hypothetical protein [Salinispora arenicola]|uniref:hypothetical protein n=1 Tax=Salinispora arenicola TaxID=168697 RepID=UPI0003AA5832|nr:hypothetical protein [Salinispora arenicola]
MSRPPRLIGRMWSAWDAGAPQEVQGQQASRIRSGSLTASGVARAAASLLARMAAARAACARSEHLGHMLNRGGGWWLIGLVRDAVWRGRRRQRARQRPRARVGRSGRASAQRRVPGAGEQGRGAGAVLGFVGEHRVPQLVQPPALRPVDLSLNNINFVDVHGTPLMSPERPAVVHGMPARYLVP